MTQPVSVEQKGGPCTEISDLDRLVRDPLVSVVMITYNHERYIAQAIEGVVSQKTDFPIELIIGEDCSTDGTRQIVLEYQRRYPQTLRVLVSEANVGMYANGWRVMLAARGKYMAFCEGDDWWHRTDKLQLQVSAFRADDSLVCFSGEIQTISAEGLIIDGGVQAEGPQPPEPIGYQNFIFPSTHHTTCTVVARTDAVHRTMCGDSLFNDHTQLLGDLPLWIELSQLGGMVHLREVLASYRRSTNSVTRQVDPLHGPRFEISSAEIRYRALERYALPGSASRTSDAKAYFSRQILVRAAWVGDFSLARKQLRRVKEVEGKVGWKDIGYAALALIPLPRRFLTVELRRIAPRLGKIGLNLRKHFPTAAPSPPCANG